MLTTPRAFRYGKLAATVVIALFLFSGCSKKPAKTLTIAYSNDLLGTIHPCDCPGQEYGGLPRRASFLEVVRDTTQNLLVLDAGDFYGLDLGFGERKAQVYVNSMALMGYDGIAVGEAELGFGTDDFVRRVSDAGLPVLAANLYDANTNQLLFPPSTRVEYPDGLSVGLIGIMWDGLVFPPQVESGSLRITDPKEALRREISGFAGGVDLVVVVAHCPLTVARNLAKAVPEIDLVICGHEGKPLRKKDQRFGNAYILQIPKEGKHAGLAFAVVGKDGGIGRLSSESVPLTSRYEDNPVISELIDEYGL
jgi:5'-nucleotidase